MLLDRFPNDLADIIAFRLFQEVQFHLEAEWGHCIKASYRVVDQAWIPIHSITPPGISSFLLRQYRQVHLENSLDIEAEVAVRIVEADIRDQC